MKPEQTPAPLAPAAGSACPTCPTCANWERKTRIMGMCWVFQKHTSLLHGGNCTAWVSQYASADAPSAKLASSIPTDPGFYWWRENWRSPWKLLRVRGCSEFSASVDDVSHGVFFGRPALYWSDDAEIGEWVAVLPPNAPDQRQPK